MAKGWEQGTTKLAALLLENTPLPNLRVRGIILPGEQGSFFHLRSFIATASHGNSVTFRAIRVEAWEGQAPSPYTVPNTCVHVVLPHAAAAARHDFLREYVLAKLVASSPNLFEFIRMPRSHIGDGGNPGSGASGGGAVLAYSSPLLDGRGSWGVCRWSSPSRPLLWLCNALRSLAVAHRVGICHGQLDEKAVIVHADEVQVDIRGWRRGSIVVRRSKEVEAVCGVHFSDADRVRLGAVLSESLGSCREKDSSAGASAGRPLRGFARDLKMLARTAVRIWRQPDVATVLNSVLSQDATATAPAADLSPEVVTRVGADLQQVLRGAIHGVFADADAMLSACSKCRAAPRAHLSRVSAEARALSHGDFLRGEDFRLTLARLRDLREGGSRHAREVQLLLRRGRQVDGGASRRSLSADGSLSGDGRTSEDDGELASGDDDAGVARERRQHASGLTADPSSRRASVDLHISRLNDAGLLLTLGAMAEGAAGGAEVHIEVEQITSGVEICEYLLSRLSEWALVLRGRLTFKCGGYTLLPEEQYVPLFAPAVLLALRICVRVQPPDRRCAALLLRAAAGAEVHLGDPLPPLEDSFEGAFEAGSPGQRRDGVKAISSDEIGGPGRAFSPTTDLTAGLVASCQSQASRFAMRRLVLTGLELSRSMLSDLCTFLGTSGTWLVALEMAHCKLGQHASLDVNLLFHQLKMVPSLDVLDVAHNALSATHGLFLARAMAMHPSLTYVDASGNLDFNVEVLGAFQAAVHRSPHHVQRSADCRDRRLRVQWRAFHARLPMAGAPPVVELLGELDSAGEPRIVGMRAGDGGAVGDGGVSTLEEQEALDELEALDDTPGLALAGVGEGLAAALTVSEVSAAFCCDGSVSWAVSPRALWARLVPVHASRDGQELTVPAAMVRFACYPMPFALLPLVVVDRSDSLVRDCMPILRRYVDAVVSVSPRPLELCLAYASLLELAAAYQPAMASTLVEEARRYCRAAGRLLSILPQRAFELNSTDESCVQSWMTLVMECAARDVVHQARFANLVETLFRGDVRSFEATIARLRKSQPHKSRRGLTLPIASSLSELPSGDGFGTALSFVQAPPHTTSFARADAPSRERRVSYLPNDASEADCTAVFASEGAEGSFAGQQSEEPVDSPDAAQAAAAAADMAVLQATFSMSRDMVLPTLRRAHLLANRTVSEGFAERAKSGLQSLLSIGSRRGRVSISSRASVQLEQDNSGLTRMQDPTSGPVHVMSSDADASRLVDVAARATAARGGVMVTALGRGRQANQKSSSASALDDFPRVQRAIDGFFSFVYRRLLPQRAVSRFLTYYACALLIDVYLAVALLADRPDDPWLVVIGFSQVLHNLLQVMLFPSVPAAVARTVRRQSQDIEEKSRETVAAVEFASQLRERALAAASSAEEMASRRAGSSDGRNASELHASVVGSMFSDKPTSLWWTKKTARTDVIVDSLYCVLAAGRVMLWKKEVLRALVSTIMLFQTIRVLKMGSYLQMRLGHILAQWNVIRPRIYAFVAVYLVYLTAFSSLLVAFNPKRHCFADPGSTVVVAFRSSLLDFGDELDCLTASAGDWWLHQFRQVVELGKGNGAAQPPEVQFSDDTMILLLIFLTWCLIAALQLFNVLIAIFITGYGANFAAAQPDRTMDKLFLLQQFAVASPLVSLPPPFTVLGLVFHIFEKLVRWQAESLARQGKDSRNRGVDRELLKSVTDREKSNGGVEELETKRFLKRASTHRELADITKGRTSSILQLVAKPLNKAAQRRSERAMSTGVESVALSSVLGSMSLGVRGMAKASRDDSRRGQALRLTREAAARATARAAHAQTVEATIYQQALDSRHGLVVLARAPAQGTAGRWRDSGEMAEQLRETRRELLHRCGLVACYAAQQRAHAEKLEAFALAVDPGSDASLNPVRTLADAGFASGLRGDVESPSRRHFTAKDGLQLLPPVAPDVPSFDSLPNATALRRKLNDDVVEGLPLSADATWWQREEELRESFEGMGRGQQLAVLLGEVLSKRGASEGGNEEVFSGDALLRLKRHAGFRAIKERFDTESESGFQAARLYCRTFPDLPPLIVDWGSASRCLAECATRSGLESWE